MYEITHSTATRYCYAWCDTSLDGFQWLDCPACGRPVPTAQYNSNVRHLLLEGGSIFPDHLCFTGAGERLFIISENALNLFEQNQITGYSGYSQATIEIDKAIIRRITKRENTVVIPRYYVLNITGSIDWDLKQIHMEKRMRCRHCGKFNWSPDLLDPKLIDISTWDGSDLCLVKSMPGYKMCTEKLKELVVRNRLTGFVFSD